LASKKDWDAQHRDVKPIYTAVNAAAAAPRRITPPAEALVRLAETLNVSIGHLLVDGIPRRPLHSAQDALGDRLAAVAELPPDDRASLLNIIDGLVAKNRLKTLAGGIS